MRTIQDMIDRAGGPDAVSKAAVRARKPLTADAVRKWPKNGVRAIYWDILSALSGATVNDIYEANCRIYRDKPRKPRRRSKSGAAVAA